MIDIKAARKGATALMIAFIIALIPACACIGNAGSNVNVLPSADTTEDGTTGRPAETPSTSGGSVIASNPPAVVPSGAPIGSETPYGTDGVQTSAEPTGGPSPTTPLPTSTQDISTPSPTPTPAPDPVTGMIWLDDSAPVYCDMDFDGLPERVEINLVRRNSYTYDCVVTITVGATNKELSSSFTTEYFSKALLNNFNSGDGRVELIVCCGSGSRDFNIHAYRLNGAATALDTSRIEGWIETADENSITIGRYLDILGTWACTSVFEIGRDEFEFVQQNAEWMVFSDIDRWCTVAQEMLVQLYISSGSDNVVGFLYAGDKLYPTSTDMATYIRFTTSTSTMGSITITVNAAGEVLISDRSPDYWFSDLEYID